MEASASTPQHISLPDAEGSVQGMGESFSPVLSAGTGTYSVPIALPTGRAGVQPSLSLSYGTSGGNGPVGFGWHVGVPFISRQTDRGLPNYIDDTTTGLWQAEEDRFIYNGGQELVPVAESAANAFDDGYAPLEFAGWQQYRARIEGGFMRFYRAPDFRTWVVEGPDGSRLEFGALPDAQLPSDFGTLITGENRSGSALETEDGSGRGRIYRWFLTRMSDAHGSTVYYRYREDEGHRYLDDIHYVSPADCAAGGDWVAQRNCSQPLSRYGRRVVLQYESRPDVFESWVPGWRTAIGLRLARIAVTAAQGAPGVRSMVRRYHLTYDAASFHSLLESVQVEGRPHAENMATEVIEQSETIPTENMLLSAGSTLLGPTLPAMRFGYSGVDRPSSASVPGFGGLDGTVHRSAGSPAHSVDEARADFFDVNSDGLPDLLVTDPARYRTSGGQPAVGVFFNGFRGGSTTPAEAGTFSDAVSVPVPAGLSGVFNLNNANVVPMDIDGDGRSDMLHMPRVARYEYFTPVRNGDADAARPSQQGWQFAYVDVNLPRDVTDPRIDLGRDGTHIRAFDVNNDHLIDIVRTTGTVMQTWLNLGWLPGGDGRFGSYRYLPGSDSYELSTAPYESCLLHSGTPIDFDDPEVQLADMNGDGIQDIVQMRRGRIRYWPGRGLGLWGVGPSSCDRGEGRRPLRRDDDRAARDQRGALRRLPARRQPRRRLRRGPGALRRGRRLVQRGRPRLHRAHHPQPHPRRARVRAARPLRRHRRQRHHRHRLRQRRPLRVGRPDGRPAPAALDLRRERPRRAHHPRVRLERGGVSARPRRGRDLLPRPTPRATASPGAPSAAAATPATAPPAAAIARPAAPSSRPSSRRCRPATSSARSAARNTISRNEYRYHDGYYEGIEQEFRGFGAADAFTTAGPGDTHRTGSSRTWFHQGPPPNDIASDRLAYSTYEALKGREFQTEAWDSVLGTRLSTTHSTYVMRQLMVGLDGRPIQYAYVSQTDELRYDTSRGRATRAPSACPRCTGSRSTRAARPPSRPRARATRSISSPRAVSARCTSRVRP
ncbi:MAG: hypothetical protein SangKO_074000 [Sandaracinaceae bacterium]